MFIRFRKAKCDALIPWGAQAKIMCMGHGRCMHRNYACPMKPRCRWRIGWDKGSKTILEPYRLNVSLVENHRVNGTVKQEHIAHIGSIAAWLLEDFFADLDAAEVTRIKQPEWELRSLQARRAFWREAIERLHQLENRIGPDMKRLRMVIHQRIPWPMEAERNRLAIMEAEAGLERAKDGFESNRRMYQDAESAAKHANEMMAHIGQAAVWEADNVRKAKQRLDDARKAADA